jgi:hypothetical protein
VTGTGGLLSCCCPSWCSGDVEARKCKAEVIGGILLTQVNLEVLPGDENSRSVATALCHQPYPYPKWPANHKSAAFESVAVKKSFILSPPEIYAECAHHGEADQTDN